MSSDRSCWRSEVLKTGLDHVRDQGAQIDSQCELALAALPAFNQAIRWAKGCGIPSSIR